MIFYLKNKQFGAPQLTSSQCLLWPCLCWRRCCQEKSRLHCHTVAWGRQLVSQSVPYPHRCCHTWSRSSGWSGHARQCRSPHQFSARFSLNIEINWPFLTPAFSFRRDFWQNTTPNDNRLFLVTPQNWTHPGCRWHQNRMTSKQEHKLTEHPIG